MSLRQILSALSPVHIYLVTLFSGAKRMGKDARGNVYYQAKARRGYNHPRRWVLYRGEPDASAVPPEWHGWLHGSQAAPPASDKPQRPWQKEYQPNLTGTAQAYRPPGHVLEGGRRAKASGDYEPWVPN